MTGIIIAFFLPIYLIGLLVMALFQMLGGKYVAKLNNATYGSAFIISLYSSLATAILLTILGKIGLLSSLGVGGSIVFSILLSVFSLAYVTKLKWKCADFSTAIKASSINIVITAIFWSIILSKFSEFL
jgi:hypothetical protein